MNLEPTNAEILLGLGSFVVVAANNPAALPVAAVLGGGIYLLRRAEWVRPYAEGYPQLNRLLVSDNKEGPKLLEGPKPEPSTNFWENITARPNQVQYSTPRRPIKREETEDDGLLEAKEERRPTRKAANQEDAIVRLPKVVTLASLKPYPESPTAVPLGVNQEGQPVWGDLMEDLLHVGIYGTSGAGKDSLLRVWFALLCKRNEPKSLKFAFLDGKGDWLTPDLAGLKHMFTPPAGGYGDKGKTAILAAIRKIDAEAARRQELIFGNSCRSREQYNRKFPDKALPLLVVVATDVMDSLAGPVEELLASLVSKARALGIRVIASMQTPTGKGMDWRMNLSSVLAGALVDGSQDGPALGVRDVTSLPFRPSKIPPPPRVKGVFVAKVAGEVMLLRTPIFSADKDANEDRFNEIVSSLPVRQRDPFLEEMLSSVSTAKQSRNTERNFAVSENHDKVVSLDTVQFLAVSGENFSPAKNAIEVLKTASSEEREKLKKTLRLWLSNGRKKTEAIRLGFDCKTGESYQRGKVLFDAALAVGNK